MHYPGTAECADRWNIYTFGIYIYIQSIWRHKGRTVGMQGLERAEGAEESQGHKALGIHRPCLGHVREQRGNLLSVTFGQQGFQIHLRAAREHFV